MEKTFQSQKLLEILKSTIFVETSFVCMFNPIKHFRFDFRVASQAHLIFKENLFKTQRIRWIQTYYIYLDIYFSLLVLRVKKCIKYEYELHELCRKSYTSLHGVAFYVDEIDGKIANIDCGDEIRVFWHV